LIGADFESDSAGSAWVFTLWEGTRFLPQGEKLTGSGESALSYFGDSVALSWDGNTALIGASGANHNGAAWVFTRSGVGWTQQTELTSKEALGEAAFGFSVALSSDGNTALIGGPFEDGFDGAAWVFTRSGVEWKQLGPKITGNEEIPTVPIGYPSEGSKFGESVALSSEANIALIGGPWDHASHGAVWTFAT
jgi:FG-GAP repeat